jgi:signal transduction histidine kinase/CheY-like chemotaxis protein
MDKPSTETKSFLSPVKGKVLAAFSLACVAIALAVTITYFSFYGLLAKVDELSVPNNKLKTLNDLFEQITKLDQQQRADAIKNPGKSYGALYNDSKLLLTTIDSLQQMSWEDERQTQRLGAMKRVLNKRNFLLVEYLKLRSGFIINKKFSFQLDSLAEVLANAKPASDSSVTTTQKKTTTTTYLPAEADKKKNFFSRIFGSKKKDSTQNRVEVKEEVSVQTDTLAIAMQDSAISQVGRIIKSLDEDQRLQNRQMIQRELDLINTNITLINQLLSILREVENEEIAAIEKKNVEAAELVNANIQRIGAILIIFFLLAALFVFLILLDISKSNYYRLQLIKAKEEAEELGRIKQRFLANMSHEIRTPLQSIIGFSDQLKNPKLKDEATEAIQISSEHLLQIVNEILDYSRIEADTFTIEKTPFDLTKLIEEVTSVIRVNAQKKGLEFIVSTTDMPDVKLLGDPFRLRQILYNLLGNALKFTPRGTVRFETEVKSDLFVKCKFQITDTGIGIQEKDITRIFSQFEQGSATTRHHYGGSGLGLSIVKKLIDLQHGTIEVKSEVDSGSTFIVELNFERARTESNAPKEIEVQSKIKPFDGRVLLVDDDPLILRLCSLMLENHHVPFTAFQQSEKALEENLDDVKIIFLDIRMPGMNGLELCKALKKKTQQARIVALTAHVLPQEQASIIESGFDQILVKPFREEEFMSVLNIQKVITKHRVSDFSFSALRQLTMGDELLFQSVLAQFIEETNNDLLDLEKKQLEKDAKAVREIVHKFSGRIAQLGEADLAKTFHLLEKELDSGKTIDELNEKIKQSVIQLNSFIESVQKEIALVR